MKVTFKLALLLVTMLGFTAAANAQSSAKATASATIVTPISIAKQGDMSFGNIILQGTSGKVVVSPEGNATPTGVRLGAIGETASAATFEVKGQADYAYSITLPTNHNLRNTSTGGGDMTVDSFVVNSESGKIGANGSQIIKVGATLNINAGQNSGRYSSADGGFEVKVNYN